VKERNATQVGGSEKARVSEVLQASDLEAAVLNFTPFKG